MDVLKRAYFKTMRLSVSSFAIAVGPLHAPWTHKRMTYKDVLELESILKVGDVILDKTYGEMSTVIIPGQWKHLMVYIGNGEVFHSTGIGTHISYLADVIMKTDEVCVRRDKTATAEMMAIKCHYIREELRGKKYDFTLDLLNQEKVFCSEVEFRGANYVHGAGFLVPLKRMGFDTFTPDDCFQADGKYETIYLNTKKEYYKK